MFNDITNKRVSWSIGLVLLGAALAVVLSFSVPKAGAVTIEELLLQIQQLQAQLVALQGSSSSPATACTFTRSLYVGVSRGEDVKCLQQYLNSTSYKVAVSGAGSMGSETMTYGPLTRTAVSQWQAANSVSPAVGYFGTISRAKYSAVAGGVVTPPGDGVVTPPSTAGGLSVGLSGTTQAARTIVAGAANMSFGKFTFMAGSGDVIVTTLKFKRSGISADAELGSAYLYDADSGDYLAQYSGLGSGVLSFTNASGLFTVKAGMVKNVELRLDVSSSASNNHTMAFSLESATDVVSNATSVSGAFPSMTNAMTFVTVSDPAIATLTATTVGTGNSVNAGTTGYLAGSFTLKSANSAVLLSRIVLTQNGSLISATDVSNIKLVTTGGQQIGGVLPNLDSSGKGTFVMSPAYEVPSGQTIQVNVYADVVAGVNRTLKFNVLNLRDIQALDKTYNVGVNPSASVAMTQSTVEAGTLTITLDPSSPTGNIAPGQTNVVVTKFKVTAYGEQVKILFVPFKVVATGAVTWTSEIDNIYLVDDAGNQIGTTITAPCGTDAGTACDSGSTADTWSNTGTTAATFGTSSSNINYLMPANTTRVWSLKLDVLSAAVITDLTASLVAGTDNYQGQISLVSTGDTTAVGGNTLTITSNPFQAKLNSAVGAGNLVRGQSAAKIGSFVLSASSAEGINVSTLTFTSSSTFPFANLMVKIGGVQFGDVKGSTAVSTDYTFSGSSPSPIPAGGSITVDVYADILTAATNLGSSTYVQLDAASAVGALTATSQTLKNTGGTAVDDGADIVGQSYTINITGGTLAIAKDAASPAAYQAVMGKTGQSLAIWRFTGTAVSDTNITDMTVTDTTGVDGNEASFENLQWYKGGVAMGPVVVSGTGSGTAGSELGYTYTFHFTSPVVIPQNTGVSLELRGNVASFLSGGATANSAHTFRIESTDDVTALSSGGSLSATISGPNGNTGTDVNAVTVTRTKLTVTSDPTGITTSGHPASSADVMAVFVFTADSANDVIISSVTLKLAGSTLATVVVQLIDEDTGTTWGSTVANNMWLVSGIAGTASTSVTFNPAYTLSGGATKRVKVQADTTGSTATAPDDKAFTATAGSTSGTLAQWIISNDTGTGGTYGIIQNALCWNDGTATCGATGVGGYNLETKVLPIYGPAIRY
ncbi:MAG: peptidoglycan-binding domain-containing protein [Candidatus Azambacteria bacterium]|nr:peptidoglycan-binding domain-containing protein [Candidatus Azambacteria bacterium]